MPPPQPGADAASRSAYVALLRNRNYRYWFLSAFGSGLGDWTGLVALQVLVLQLTERGSQLALFALSGIMMARLLPSVVVGPVAGVFADRYDRKRLMLVTTLCRGAIFLVLAFSRDLWAVFALTFLVECLTLLYMSAKDASLPVMVRRDQLQPASQLNLLATIGPFPLGPAIASLMVPAAALLRGLGVEGANETMLALLVNAGMLFVAVGLLTQLSLPPHGRRAHEEAASGGSQGLVAELREGLAFIRELPVVRALITGVVGVFFGAGAIVALGPAFVRDSLGGAESDWFVMMASVGVGLAAGLVAVPLLTRRLQRERIFPVALLLTGVIATTIALLQQLALALVLALALGASAGISVVLGYTLLQEHTEDHVRGKTFAAFYTATRISMFAALALGPAAAGVIGTGQLILGDFEAEASGIRIMILLAGVVVTVSALGTLRGMWRWLRVEHGATRPVTLDQLAAPGSSGVFVAVEGVEGSGKSTQVARLAETLRGEGFDVVVTREPGGPPVAERIRGVLLDPASTPMSAHTEALLLAAARAEHVRQTILPALDAGKVVICDRFVDSSLAYQGYARGLGERDVFEINRWAIGGLMPDASVLLHLDAEQGLQRVDDRDAGRRHLQPAEAGPPPAAGDRMEREDPEFHRRVAEGYLRLARRERHRFVVVDASGDADLVARQVRSGLHPWLPLPEHARPDEGAAAEESGSETGTGSGVG